MDPITAIRERLKNHSNVRAEEKAGSIVVHPSEAAGFAVGLYADEKDYVVSFDGWHEHFSSPEEALNCFAFGLSEACRLRVHKRGGKAYSWTVEHKDNDAWVPESTTGLLFFPFWHRLEVIHLQNRLLPANSTPHTDARAPAALNQPSSARAGERGR